MPEKGELPQLPGGQTPSKGEAVGRTGDGRSLREALKDAGRADKVKTEPTSPKNSNEEEFEIIQGEVVDDDEFIPKASGKSPDAEPQEKTPFSDEAAFVAGAAVGAAANEIHNRNEQNTQNNSSTESSGNPKEGEKAKDYSFAEVNKLRKDQSLPEDERKYWQAQWQKRVEDFEQIEDGNFKADMERAVQKRLRENDWDNVYDELNELGTNFENQFQASHGRGNERLVGITKQAIRAEAARVLLAGIDGKHIPRRDFGDWLKQKGYSQGEIDRLTKLATEDSIFNLATDAPQELVGKNYKKTEASGSSDQKLTNEILMEMFKGQQEMLGFTAEQTNALTRGFKVLVGLTETKTLINPSTFETQPPVWYENLSREEKEAVKTVLIFNYISGIMITTGEADLGTWANIGNPEGYNPVISVDSISHLFKHFPGFRVALSTMTNDIFTKGLNTGAMYISDNGYRLLSDTDGWKQYKKDLASSLVEYFKNNAEAEKWRVDKKLTFEEMSILMVSAADNLLMGTTSYLAGDMKRPYDPRTNDGGRFKMGIEDPGVNGGDDIRAFLNPGLKLPKKLLKEGEKFSKKEEFWLGKFGEWMRFNSINNVDGFRDDYKKGKVNYVPNKLFPGILEFNTLEDKNQNGRRGGRTVAHALVNEARVSLGKGVGSVPNLVDYADGGNAIDFNATMVKDWFGSYSGKRAQALKLYQNLGSSGGPRTSAITVEAFYNAMERVRNMDCMNLIPELKDAYYNKDFVIASLAQIISKGEGPILGTRELILKVDPKAGDYNVMVMEAVNTAHANILNSVNLSRKQVMKIFHATDLSKLSLGSVAASLGLDKIRFARKERVLSKAVRTINKANKRIEKRNRNERIKQRVKKVTDVVSPLIDKYLRGK